MADIYAYTTHTAGVADDSALELVAAAKKIDAKVERMAPVLSEPKLKQYRNYLESSGGLFNMMMQGMEVQTEK